MLRRLFQSWPTERKGTIAAPSAALVELFGAPTSATGRAVTRETALRVPAVYAAVRAIAEAVGQLPVHVYWRGEDGSRERDADHPAHRLLALDANPWTGAGELREQLTADALLEGNGFAFVNRVGGAPDELIRLKPEAVQVLVDLETGEPSYRVSDGEFQRDVDRRDMLHVRGLTDRDGVVGYATTALCREAIALGLVLEEHAARLFGTGARPGGVLKAPGKLSDEAAKRIAASWSANHGGARNAGGTAILEEGMTWEALSLTSTDAQFLEMREFQIQEVARAFRVPPVLLMDYGRATWSNSEEMGRQFLTYTLAPWLRRWEGAIRRALFAPDERETYEAAFDTTDLLRTDLQARATAYSTLIQSRVLSPNEARAREGLPPYAGGERFENPNTTAGGEA